MPGSHCGPRLVCLIKSKSTIEDLPPHFNSPLKCVLYILVQRAEVTRNCRLEQGPSLFASSCGFYQNMHFENTDALFLVLQFCTTSMTVQHHLVMLRMVLPSLYSTVLVACPDSSVPILSLWVDNFYSCHVSTVIYVVISVCHMCLHNYINYM